MSRHLEAVNDPLIYEFLENPNYLVTDEGEIYSFFTLQGHPSDEPRLVGTVKAGHLKIKYQDTSLFAHRIVYAAKKGKLKPDLRIIHGDGNRLNNHPNNLVSGDQSLVNHARFDENIYAQPAVIGHRKDEKQEKARELRKKGFSVKEIEQKLNVSRSSVSVWVRDIALTSKQQARLTQKISDNGGS